jgi:hypothetical protein
MINDPAYFSLSVSTKKSLIGLTPEWDRHEHDEQDGNGLLQVPGPRQPRNEVLEELKKYNSLKYSGGSWVWGFCELREL